MGYVRDDERAIETNIPEGGVIMPYILGWFLGVPLIVLVLLYLIFH